MFGILLIERQTCLKSENHCIDKEIPQCEHKFVLLQAYIINHENNFVKYNNHQATNNQYLVRPQKTK